VNIDKQKVDRRMERFNKACRDSGAKLTHQRMEIFREVAQTGEHPDVESVYRGVRERMPTVSLDTVYRTLWWLKDFGLVATLGSSRERTRFDANLDRHHHFVCTRCGLTRDFYSQKLDKLNITESVQAIGTVETTQVEVKGVCLECAEKEREPNQAIQPRR
jgi:Fur family transcriptional regulator, peroxide stress response regulator